MDRALAPGGRVGRLVLIKQMKTNNKNYSWECQCDCGNVKIIPQSNLKRRKKPTQSCGCLAKELSRLRAKQRIKPSVKCEIDGCNKNAESKSGGMCGMHAQRMRRYGDPFYVTNYEEWRKLCRKAAMERQVEPAKPQTYLKFHGRHAHRVVAEQSIGRALRQNEIVHHIDGNRHNNSPENLQIMTQSEHIKLHKKEMDEKRIKNAKA